jgi:hypothetical protein
VPHWGTSFNRVRSRYRGDADLTNKPTKFPATEFMNLFPYSTRHPDDRLVELSLPPWTGIGKSGQSPRRLPCNKAGASSAYPAESADFTFIRTLLVRGFRWNA